MEQIELLEMELKLLQENIVRMKQFRKENKGTQYPQYSSRVVGEFKHRLVALKQRLTLVSKMATHNFLEN